MEGYQPMGCTRCPYLVRRGQYEKQTKSIVFKNQCALKIKTTADPTVKPKTKTENPDPDNANNSTDSISCNMHPLIKSTDYLYCETYRKYFTAAEDKRNVVPTKELEYSNNFKSPSLLDLELL